MKRVGKICFFVLVGLLLAGTPVNAGTEEGILLAPPTTGTVRFPIILVGFKDKPFTKTNEAFQKWATEPNYKIDADGDSVAGSIYDYFKANSYGKIEYLADVYGPYQLNGNIATYDRQKMSEDAVKAADAAGVDFSKYAGMGGAVHIIFAGYSEAEGDPTGMTPAKGSMNVTVDGVKFTVRSCSSELWGNPGRNPEKKMSGIGPTAHELGHVFGIHDYYDTSGGNGNVITPGKYDIMAAQGAYNLNGLKPANHSAYTKSYLGWSKTVVLDSPANIRLPRPLDDIANGENIVYQINTKTPKEFFLIENRQQEGFDEGIPGSGMLIYHVDENKGGRPISGSGNNNPAHRCYYIKQAGGGINSDSEMREFDPYPSKGNTTFTDTSIPNAQSWAGANTEKPVTHIRQNPDGSVSFRFMGGIAVYLNSNIPGAGTIAGEGEYEKNATATVTAVPADGYRFLQWRTGDEVVSTDATYSFTITGPVYLDADFIPVEAVINVVSESFEYNAPGWIFVNGSQTNQWITGSAVDYSGKAAYISNDNGVTNAYSTNSTSTVHLYRDITFPAMTDISGNQLQLHFDWRGRGEYSSTGLVNDYLEVRLIETADTPAAGVALSAGTSLGKFYGADWQHAAVSIPDTYAETSKRLVFTWINNGSNGNQSPVVIDNVEINVIRSAKLISEAIVKKKNKDDKREAIFFNGVYPFPKCYLTAPEWITIIEGSGIPEEPVWSFTVADNGEPSLREGIITVAMGNDKLNVKVIQAGKQPENLAATAENGSVRLTWDAIGRQTPIPETQKRWNTAYNTGISFPQQERVEAAIRFAPEDLSAYNQTKIKAVNIQPATLPKTMDLVIRQNEEIVYTQPLEGLKPGMATKINLAASVPVDVTKELLVGYVYTQTPGADAFPIIGADAGPAESGKGNIIALDRGPFTSSDENRNWNIAMYVSSDPVVSYNVFRGNELIASALKDTSYVDANPSAGAVYSVTAVYNDDTELQSTAATIDYTGIKSFDAGSRLDISLQENALKLHNRADEPATVSFYNLSGQLVRTLSLKPDETASLLGLNRGVYLVKATYVRYGDVRYKLLLNK
ncbi:MAG: M6 family metalloprotease domain-containing protein [Candidatus Symbiothrix sp.]|jgi:M6 family metalloprotease-like protein|nr:M6 family metalloprotease domain-containing protein [Candidatus Symbiothrix sp.]